MKKTLSIFFISALLLCSSALATPPAQPTENQNADYLANRPTANKTDPLEGFNRLMFHVHDTFDEYFFKPLTRFYNNAMPAPLYSSINYFYLNMGNINAVANDILQFNFYQATSDSWRLAINSTAGLGGFFDPATSLGLSNNPQDFGLTLAKWGWKNSTYLFLPIYGPRTLRDTVAIMPDNYMSIYPYINSMRASNSLYGLSLVNTRAQLLKMQEVYSQVSIEPYVFMRNAYLQRRDYLINRTTEMDSPTIAKNVKNAESNDVYYLNE
ncbi:MAG: VacJ family lipoprotein [Pseudomonadota bacterium]|mgnify:FL=1